MGLACYSFLRAYAPTTRRSEMLWCVLLMPAYALAVCYVATVRPVFAKNHTPHLHAPRVFRAII